MENERHRLIEKQIYHVNFIHLSKKSFGKWSKHYKQRTQQINVLYTSIGISIMY